MSSTPGDAVEQVSRFLGLAVTPGGIRGLLTWKPRSIAAIRLVGSLVGRGLSFATVLDVGANAGQFSRAARGFWPAADIIAFEPLPQCVQQLESALVPLGRTEVHAVALGRDNGIIGFHPHTYTLSSSVLSSTRCAKDDYGWARELPPIDVPVRRLDSVLEGRILRRPALLKLDVQGFELEVIEGASATMDVIDAVLVEMAFERVYEGQPLFDDVHSLLTGRGWVLNGPIDARREGGRIVELDCLYSKPEVPGYSPDDRAETPWIGRSS